MDSTDNEGLPFAGGRRGRAIIAATRLRPVPVQTTLPALIVGCLLTGSCAVVVPSGQTQFATARSPSPSSAAVDAPTETALLQKDVNQLRQVQGIEALAFPAALQQIALARALDLAASGVLDHGSGPNAAVLRMLQAAGYSGRLAEHVILVTDSGVSLAATVMRAWFSDLAHRADLLDPVYHAAGIALAPSGEGWLVVHVLAEAGIPQEMVP